MKISKLNQFKLKKIQNAHFLVFQSACIASDIIFLWQILKSSISLLFLSTIFRSSLFKKAIRKPQFNLKFIKF